MYYGDISDAELQLYHNLKINNFSISLTDLLNIGLFKVETIISDRLYRVYPLFYTTIIQSSNTNDKILENKCIICTKQETETYYTFISDENSPITDYFELLSVQYKEIGDSLSTSEYNGIVSLLRRNVIFNEDLTLLTKGTIDGKYGTYTLDIKGIITDKGIFINNEEYDGVIGTIKLTNNKLRWSKYVLELTITYIKDINLSNEYNTNEIVTDTITIDLNRDTALEIEYTPLYDTAFVVSDPKISIDNNIPIIRYINGLKVNASANIMQIGENNEITAELLDIDGLHYDLSDGVGKTVYFYERLVPTLTLNADPSIIQTGETTDITCKVKDEDGSIAKNTKVYFYIKEE